MTDHHTRQRLLFIKGYRTAERLKAACMIALFFLGLGIVGRMDYEYAVAMEAAANAQRPQAVQLASATESTTCGK